MCKCSYCVLYKKLERVSKNTDAIVGELKDIRRCMKRLEPVDATPSTTVRDDACARWDDEDQNDSARRPPQRKPRRSSSLTVSDSDSSSESSSSSSSESESSTESDESSYAEVKRRRRSATTSSLPLSNRASTTKVQRNIKKDDHEKVSTQKQVDTHSIQPAASDVSASASSFRAAEAEASVEAIEDAPSAKSSEHDAPKKEEQQPTPADQPAPAAASPALSPSSQSHHSGSGSSTSRHSSERVVQPLAPPQSTDAPQPVATRDPTTSSHVEPDSKSAQSTTSDDMHLSDISGVDVEDRKAIREALRRMLGPYRQQPPPLAANDAVAGAAEMEAAKPLATASANSTAGAGAVPPEVRSFEEAVIAAVADPSKGGVLVAVADAAQREDEDPETEICSKCGGVVDDDDPDHDLLTAGSEDEGSQPEALSSRSAIDVTYSPSQAVPAAPAASKTAPPKVSRAPTSAPATRPQQASVHLHYEQRADAESSQETVPPKRGGASATPKAKDVPLEEASTSIQETLRRFAAPARKSAPPPSAADAKQASSGRAVAEGTPKVRAPHVFKPLAPLPPLPSMDERRQQRAERHCASPDRHLADHSDRIDVDSDTGGRSPRRPSGREQRDAPSSSSMTGSVSTASDDHRHAAPVPPRAGGRHEAHPKEKHQGAAAFKMAGASIRRPLGALPEKKVVPVLPLVALFESPSDAHVVQPQAMVIPANDWYLVEARLQVVNRSPEHDGLARLVVLRNGEEFVSDTKRVPEADARVTQRGKREPGKVTLRVQHTAYLRRGDRLVPTVKAIEGSALFNDSCEETSIEVASVSNSQRQPVPPQRRGRGA